MVGAENDAGLPAIPKGNPEVAGLEGVLPAKEVKRPEVVGLGSSLALSFTAPNVKPEDIGLDDSSLPSSSLELSFPLSDEKSLNVNPEDGTLVSFLLFSTKVPKEISEVEKPVVARLASSFGLSSNALNENPETEGLASFLLSSSLDPSFALLAMAPKENPDVKDLDSSLLFPVEASRDSGVDGLPSSLSSCFLFNTPSSLLIPSPSELGTVERLEGLSPRKDPKENPEGPSLEEETVDPKANPGVETAVEAGDPSLGVDGPLEPVVSSLEETVLSLERDAPLVPKVKPEEDPKADALGVNFGAAEVAAPKENPAGEEVDAGAGAVEVEEAPKLLAAAVVIPKVEPAVDLGSELVVIPKVNPEVVLAVMAGVAVVGVPGVLALGLVVVLDPKVKLAFFPKEGLETVAPGVLGAATLLVLEPKVKLDALSTDGLGAVREVGAGAAVVAEAVEVAVGPALDPTPKLKILLAEEEGRGQALERGLFDDVGAFGTGVRVEEEVEVGRAGGPAVAWPAPKVNPGVEVEADPN